MDKFTVACVQVRMRLHASIQDYQDDLRRFLRAADAKRARLVVFPELAGQLLAPLLLRDRKTNLLRRAEAGRRPSAGAWEKVRGRAAGWLASALKADLRTSTAALLDLEPQRFLAFYDEIFGGFARAQGVTILAPSAMLPTESGALVNQSSVYGADGALLGRQARVLAAPEPGNTVAGGLTWQVIPTEVGRLGIILGTDVLYPEVGRLLAYQNAEVLLLQAASTGAAAYNKLRTGLMARMLDNQLYAAASFAVGESPLRPGEEAYSGRSVIMAPQELTPKGNGVLVEMGSGQSEGVVTAEWDFTVLRKLWEVSETPLLRAQDPSLAAPLLAALHAQLQALPHARAIELLPAPSGAEPSVIEIEFDNMEDDGNVVDLDDLPLLGTVTSRWPLSLATHEVHDVVTENPSVEWSEAELPGDEARSYEAAVTATTIRRDDETDEMDAVKGQPKAHAEQPETLVDDTIAVSAPETEVDAQALDEPLSSPAPDGGAEDPE